MNVQRLPIIKIEGDCIVNANHIKSVYYEGHGDQFSLVMLFTDNEKLYWCYDTETEVQKALDDIYTQLAKLLFVIEEIP